MKKTASRFLRIEKPCLRGYHGLVVVAGTAVSNSPFDLVLFQFFHGPRCETTNHNIVQTNNLYSAKVLQILGIIVEFKTRTVSF